MSLPPQGGAVVGAGGKVRVVSPDVIGQAYVTKSIAGEGKMVWGSKIAPADVLRYGCEVLVKVRSGFAMGGGITGEKQTQKTTTSGSGLGLGLETTTETTVKTLGANVKAVWVIPDKKKKSKTAR